MRTETFGTTAGAREGRKRAGRLPAESPMSQPPSQRHAAARPLARSAHPAATNRGGRVNLRRMSDSHSLPLATEKVFPFDARAIAKRFRHAAIFGALDALTPGETMRFMNDHDPLPLLKQLRERYGESVGVEYQKRDPGEIVIHFVKR